MLRVNHPWVGNYVEPPTPPLYRRIASRAFLCVMAPLFIGVLTIAIIVSLCVLHRQEEPPHIWK